MNIVIRVDASLKMGTGHVMRCLTLAGGLIEYKHSVTFICRDLQGHLAEYISRRGYKVIILPAPITQLDVTKESVKHADWLEVSWQQDAEEVTNAIKEFKKTDWLIVDHYALDQDWQQCMRNVVEKIMVIDDLKDRQHDCDILLDQTYMRVDEDYRHLVMQETEFLLGTEYALLNPVFNELRQKKMRDKEDQVCSPRVLISMGGVDPDNITGRVLFELEKFDQILNIDVVLKHHAPNFENVKAVIQNMKHNISLHSQVDIEQMAQLMFEATVAVGAGGTTSWERCCLGLPSIVISMADNQDDICRALSKAGAINHVGNKNEDFGGCLLQGIEQLLFNKANYELMVSKAFDIVDGLGVKRVCERLLV